MLDISRSPLFGGGHLRTVAVAVLVFALTVGVVTTVMAEDLTWESLLETGHRCSGLPEELILSVIWVESRGNPNAININGGKSYSPKTREQALKILYANNKASTDIGLMQVNYKTWGKVFGLKASAFLDPETNVCAGSQILRAYVDQHKGSWRGVGRYNAASSSKQMVYAVKVGNAYKKIVELYKRKTAEAGALPVSAPEERVAQATATPARDLVEASVQPLEVSQ